MNLSGRQRKILKIVGYVALALVAFVFALARTFPYDRVKDRMIEALSDKYDVEIGEMRAGLLPGDVVIESMKLTSRPKTPGEKPAIIFIERVDIDIGLFSLLFRKLNVEVVAAVPGGAVRVEIAESKAGRRVKIHTEGLALGSLPWVKDAIGLPMEGPLNVEAEIWLPLKKWKDADGEVSFTCTGCTVGNDTVLTLPTADPNEKRRTAQSAAIFASAGVTVPKLKLGVAEGKVIIKKGVGTFESFGAKSSDGWVKLTEAELKFADPVERSALPGCLRFFFTEELITREPTFTNIRIGWERARQDDGSYAFPLKGKLAALRPNLRRRCQEGGGDDDDPTERVSSRPTISLPTIPADTGAKEAEPETPTIETTPPDGKENGEDEGELTTKPAAALSTDALRNAKREEGDSAGHVGGSEGEGENSEQPPEGDGDEGGEGGEDPPQPADPDRIR